MKRVLAIVICLAVFFAACDNPAGDEAITTLTIRNESAHEIIDVIWNNASFASRTNPIGPGTSETMDVRAGTGSVHFRSRSNFLNLRTQDLVTVAEGGRHEFVLLNSTLVIREDGNTIGTFGDIASEAAITWEPSTVGSPTTTAVNFTFATDPGALTAADFTITPDSGSATRGTLSGSGTVRTLNVSGVRAGTVLVSINRAGIAGEPQSVTLSAPNITWTANAVGGSATTHISFAFSAVPEGLVASDFTIAPGSGSATRGALSGTGTTRTLAVSNVATGTVSVSIARAGIESGPQTVTLAVPPLGIAWTVSAVGSPATTAMEFTFGTDPGALSADNITITSGTGAATRGLLTGTGTRRTLTVSNVDAGTVSVSINRAGIASGPQTVALSASLRIHIYGIPRWFSNNRTWVEVLHPTTLLPIERWGPHVLRVSGVISSRFLDVPPGNYIVAVEIEGEGHWRTTTTQTLVTGDNPSIPWSAFAIESMSSTGRRGR